MTVDLSTDREEFLEIAASELVTFAAAIADAGLAGFALRSRFVANECLWLLAELQSERHARAAALERCERLQAIIGKGAYQALVDAEAGL